MFGGMTEWVTRISSADPDSFITAMAAKQNVVVSEEENQLPGQHIYDGMVFFAGFPASSELSSFQTLFSFLHLVCMLLGIFHGGVHGEGRVSL